MPHCQIPHEFAHSDVAAAVTNDPLHFFGAAQFVFRGRNTRPPPFMVHGVMILYDRLTAWHSMFLQRSLIFFLNLVT